METINNETLSIVTPELKEARSKFQALLLFVNQLNVYPMRDRRDLFDLTSDTERFMRSKNAVYITRPNSQIESESSALINILSHTNRQRLIELANEAAGYLESFKFLYIKGELVEITDTEIQLDYPELRR